MVRMSLLAIAALFLLTEGIRYGRPRNSSLVRVESSEYHGSRMRTGIEELEDWQDSGEAVACGLSDSDLKATVDSITGQGFNKEINNLVNLAPSRFFADKGNDKAATYIQSSLEHLGFHVTEQPIAYKSFYLGPNAKGPKRGNLIAYMPGTDLKDELVVFGAHYDSVNWKNTNDRAPGADDNGSGSAALLQIAKMLSQHAKSLRRSVALAAFQAEEEGLVGSIAFVEELKKGKYGHPVAAVIADEVSFAGRPGHAGQAIFETKGRKPANVAMIDTFAHQAKADGALKGFEVNYKGFGSDHIPFLDAGFPAVLLIERDNMYYADTYGHTRDDDLNNTNAEFGAAMTRLAARTVLSYAVPK